MKKLFCLLTFVFIVSLSVISCRPSSKLLDNTSWRKIDNYEDRREITTYEFKDGKAEKKVVGQYNNVKEDIIVSSSRASYIYSDGMLKIGDDIFIVELENGIMLDASGNGLERVE